MYGYDGPNQDSDEIDFEFLSSEAFDSPREVLTNPWDDSQQKPVSVVMPEAFDLTDWQTFRIYWRPDACVKWTWIDPGTGNEVVLRTEAVSHIPDEAMSLYFNFWAPTEAWHAAYDAGLQPDQQDNGMKYEYFIDYTEVRVPGPSDPGDFDEDGDVDANDIDILYDNLGDTSYDLDGDNDADENDMTYLIENLVQLQDGSGRIGTKRGDFNLDGFVNATDLAIMNPNFGLSGKNYPHGNANCDDLIDATDLAILGANFGFAASTAFVPEPATLGLLALGGLALLKRRS